MRIAFYAPLKPPDSPVPSGDRLMARQFITLLEALGHEVRLVSRLRSRLREPDELSAMMLAAGTELAALRDVFGTWRPELWFTYHLYYRAPDLLGPALSRELAIPYVAAEASHAAKRAVDGWAHAHALATQAMIDADLLIALTERDALGLEALEGRKGRLLRLRPFLTDAGPEPPARAARAGPVSLACVAMMREGGKLASYRLLAEALRPLRHLSWRLTLIGDGPARPDVERAFAWLEPDRIDWHGQLGPDLVRQALAEADFFVWPGYNEPFGMVYLEAAARGLASVAMASGGVPEVVRPDETGLLADHGDVPGLSACIARLIEDAGLRARLGAGARAMVVRERNLAEAACLVSAALDELETAHAG